MWLSSSVPGRGARSRIPWIRGSAPSRSSVATSWRSDASPGRSISSTTMSSFFPRAARRCWYVLAAGSIPTETAASRGAIPRAWRAALRWRDRSYNSSASGLPTRSRTVLPGDPRLDEVRDAAALLVAAVDRAIEVLGDRLHLGGVLDRREVDHHVEG